MAKKLKITANKNSNMYDIAKAFGTTVEELKKYNNLDSNYVRVGLEFFWETDDVLGVKDRLVAIEKIRLANEAKKNQTKYDPKIREELTRKLKEFTKEEDYGDLTQHLIRDYQNFKKMGLGKTVADFKKYKENESRSAKQTRDNALKLGTGVVAGAALASAPSNPIIRPLLLNSFSRSIMGSYAGLSAAAKAGLDETGQRVAGYIGGGFAGLSGNLLKLGLRSTVVEGLSNTAGFAAAGETSNALEKTQWSNSIKVPLTFLASYWGRRGFNSGVRNAVKNTKWGQDLILKLMYNPESAFSSQGHVLPKVENTDKMLNYYLKQAPETTFKKYFQAPVRGILKGLHTINPSDKAAKTFLHGVNYAGAQTLKSMPVAAVGLGTGMTMDYMLDLVPKEYQQQVNDATNIAMPILLNKSFKAVNNFNRGTANFLTYSSGGTGSGIGDALLNTAKIALGKPLWVNMLSHKLNKPELAKGLALSFWDSLPIHRTANGYGRNYKPGGYGLLYWTTKGNQGGSWHNYNKNLFLGHNPISHMFIGSNLGPGVVSTGKYIRLGTNQTPGTQYDALINRSLGWSARYGDRPIEIVTTGNKLDWSDLVYATKFDRKGKVLATSPNIRDALIRESVYNADTGVRRNVKGSTNLTVNTKGLPAIVAIDKQGRLYSIGTDLYGVGSGKKTLLESMYGSYMDAHTNPIITVSANAYTPTQSRKGTQSFGSEVYKDVPIYAK